LIRRRIATDSFADIFSIAAGIAIGLRSFLHGARYRLMLS
jgi:hypothetical protein